MTTTVNLDELAMRSEDECPIINGRYQVLFEGAKKATSCQRMTNFVKPLDDPFNINRWDCRNVAIGVAHNDDLRDMVIATRPDDKDGLNKLCDLAKDAAGGNKKSRQGTARHGITERVDLGEITVDDVPPSLRPDIAAYRDALGAAGIEIIEIEKYVVHPDLAVAGRFDRIVSFGSVPKILDIKTGSLDYSAVTMAAQLYGYASANSIYDPKTQTHRPMLHIDQDSGIIAHLPTGQGRCDLYFVDLAIGRQGFELAGQLRALRQRRDVLDQWRPGTRLDALIERRVGLTTRLETLRTVNPAALAKVAAAWPEGLPTLKQSIEHTPEQLSVIDNLLNRIETEYQAPFGPTDPNSNASLKGASA